MENIKREPEASESGTNTDRRRFMQGAAAAGLLSTAAITPVMAEPQPPQAQQVVSTPDPPRPPTLGQGKQLDRRFTANFELAVPAAMTVLIQYFTALSNRDLAGISRTLHYPHGTYEGPGTDAVIVESAEALMSNPPPSMNVTGKGDHLIAPGAFDILDGIHMHVCNPSRVGFSLDYSRFEANGNKILECGGLYYITNNDGRWGIQMASTIFNAADQVGQNYDDILLELIHLGRDMWLPYILDDQMISRNPFSPNRHINGAYTPGKQASVRRLNGNDARQGGDVWDRYMSKGVKTRLVVRDVPEEIPPVQNAPAFEANRVGMGEAVGTYKGTLSYPHFKIIHACDNKVHAYDGIMRYTTDWRVIAELNHLQIYTYKHGLWARANGIDPDYYRDRTNDART
jgi:hypothetical protein